MAGWRFQRTTQQTSRGDWRVHAVREENKERMAFLFVRVAFGYRSRVLRMLARPRGSSQGLTHARPRQGIRHNLGGLGVSQLATW